jgi:hypothetical protein
MDNPEKQATLDTPDTGNIGHTRHRTQTNKTKHIIVKLKR